MTDEQQRRPIRTFRLIAGMLAVAVVVSGGAAEHLRLRGVDPAKISVAQHWVDTQGFSAPVTRDVRAEYAWHDRFVVMFAGNLGMVQGLETIIQAAVLVPDSVRSHFVFVGDGADRAHLERLAVEHGLRNVEFVGRHVAGEMPAFLQAADGLLVHLRQDGVGEFAIPTKILSYLAAARPILCAAGGASAELMREADAGLITQPGDAAGLADAIARLAAMTPGARAQLGENGRRYLSLNLDKSRVIDFYETALKDLARPGHRRPVTAGQRT